MSSKLEAKVVPLSSLCLDPNNPRFADISSSANPVREEKVHEDSVQQKAMGKIQNENFDVQQLKESIATIGFLPVDQLVVVELPEPEKYMVVEGNRRLAALKLLAQEELDGEVDLKDEVKATLSGIPILELVSKVFSRSFVVNCVREKRTTD